MRAAKFWVAALVGLAAFLRVYTGVDFGVDDATATAIVQGVLAVLVYCVPNRSAK